MLERFRKDFYIHTVSIKAFVIKEPIRKNVSNIFNVLFYYLHKLKIIENYYRDILPYFLLFPFKKFIVIEQIRRIESNLTQHLGTRLSTLIYFRPKNNLLHRFLVHPLWFSLALDNRFFPLPNLKIYLVRIYGSMRSRFGIRNTVA